MAASRQRSDSDRPPRRRRRTIHGVLVALDAPQLAEEPWVVDAIDINANGMGLVLPPEMDEGTEVYLSFKLEDSIELSRVPAKVRHQMGASGGVRFLPWPSADRLELLEYLIAWYEQED